MSMQKRLRPQFEIEVRVTYRDSESHPENNYFHFSYDITVINRGTSTAQLMSRHWIITDGEGQVEEVRGAGVVGLQPKILPGQRFQYESSCPLSTPTGSMKGFFQMVGEDGETFEIEVPEFYLLNPSALH